MIALALASLALLSTTTDPSSNDVVAVLQPGGGASGLAIAVHDVAFTAPGGTRLAATSQGVLAAPPGGAFVPTAWFFDFGAHTNAILADPNDPGRWLAGGVGAFFDNATVRVLTNGGASVSTPYELFGAGQVLSLAFDPFDASRVLGAVFPAGFGASGVILGESGGASWDEVPGTTGLSSVDVAWSPLVPDHATALLVTSSLAVTEDAWESFDIVPAGPGAGAARFFAYDPFDAARRYRGDGALGLARSDDGGLSWDPLGVPLALRADVELSPIAPGLLWVSSSDGRVLASGDGGESFVPQLELGGGTLPTALALDASDGTLLVGTSNASALEIPGASPYVAVGAGLAGSGGIVPRHFAHGGLPELGNAGWTLAADRLLGGTSAALLVGLSQVALPAFGGMLFAGPPYPVLVSLATGGTPGAQGEGAISFAAPLPAAPALAGVVLVSQVAVLDPGAPAGIAFSNGWRTELLR